MKTILFGSILKPCDDVRMYEKMAKSLINNDFNIHIAGFKNTQKESLPNNTHFHVINKGSRFSLTRIIAPFLFLSLCIKIKPNIIIVCTHELLISSVLYKLFFGTKIIYDIQENYYLNIIHTNAFPYLIKFFVANYVKIKEFISVKFCTGIIVAEQCYLTEIQHITHFKNTLVLPNFYLKKSHFIKKEINDSKLKLAYTGTISLHYGIEDAITLAINLHELHKNISLCIAGYCADNQYRNYLIQKYKVYSFIEWIGINELVPHKNIIEIMSKADAVLLPYQNNTSTENRIPTKVFECLSLGIPVIAPINQKWSSLIIENNAGILIDFSNINTYKELSTEIKNNRFYKNGIPTDYLWDNTYFLNWINK